MMKLKQDSNNWSVEVSAMNLHKGISACRWWLKNATNNTKQLKLPQNGLRYVFLLGHIRFRFWPFFVRTWKTSSYQRAFTTGVIGHTVWGSPSQGAHYHEYSCIFVPVVGILNRSEGANGSPSKAYTSSVPTNILSILVNNAPWHSIGGVWCPVDLLAFAAPGYWDSITDKKIANGLRSQLCFSPRLGGHRALAF